MDYFRCGIGAKKMQPSPKQCNLHQQSLKNHERFLLTPWDSVNKNDIAAGDLIEQNNSD